MLSAMNYVKGNVGVRVIIRLGVIFSVIMICKQNRRVYNLDLRKTCCTYKLSTASDTYRYLHFMLT